MLVARWHKVLLLLMLLTIFSVRTFVLAKVHTECYHYGKQYYDEHKQHNDSQY